MAAWSGPLNSDQYWGLLQPPERTDFAAIGCRSPWATPRHPSRLGELAAAAAEPARCTPGCSHAAGWGRPWSHPESAADLAASAAPRAEHGGEAERLDPAQTSRPRSFSGQCAQVLGWQAPLVAFDPHEVFGSCAFFEACSTYFIRELVAACGPAVWKGQTFGQGTTVYREGDSGASMFVVVRGQAELVGPGGGPGQLLGAGSFFGEAQLLGVLPVRGETVRAHVPLRLLEVTCSAFTRLLQHTSEREEHHQHPSEQEGHARRQFHTFSNERRHFEQLTARLFRPSERRRGAPRVAREKTTGTGGAGEQEGDAAALPRARELGPPATPSPRQQHRARPRISFLQAGAPAAPPQAQAVCGLQNPRLWREARDRMTRVLVSGGLPGGALPLEGFHQRLAESIRDDLQRGYLVPADVARRARTNMSAQNAIWTERRRQQSGVSPKGQESKTLFQAMKVAAAKNESRPGTSSARGAPEGPADTDEEQRHMLSLQLLPGIDVMSVEQKHALAHDLEQRLTKQCGARRFKSAVGVVRASSIRLVGAARDAPVAEAGCVPPAA